MNKRENAEPVVFVHEKKYTAVRKSREEEKTTVLRGVCAHIQGQKLCICDTESKRANEQTKNKNLSGRQNG